MLNHSCPICGNADVSMLYQASNIPVLQNKVYNTEHEACASPVGNIALCQCSCGFVYNDAFDEELVIYDSDYQNEQGHSAFFQEHLLWVADFIKLHTSENSKITEVGCGKGHFLEILRKSRKKITGYDPTYEGNAPYIIKEFFSSSTVTESKDFIVLRHVLEHIKNPLSFLRLIAEANNYQGQIYIEVPCFDWIVKHNAFWDVCYEHVNYFTVHTFSQIFPNATIGHCFGDQYLYVLADLKELQSALVPVNTTMKDDTPLSLSLSLSLSPLNDSLQIYIWGAGAKGNMFCNVLDKNKSVFKAVVDKNPKKQNRYIGGSGHEIISPENLLTKIDNTSMVLVMNQNYYQEIKDFIKNKSQIIKVEDLWTTEKNL